ncbi:hypothetical protein DL93DRAFT_2088415 [Clavulina sp. PMI_390]|nr:hypothetical protein DL93DRAFT_2088415 [Clavulina sp. PMI_390]
MSASNLPLELLWTTLRNLTTATPFGTEYIDPDSLLAFSLVCRWWRQVALEEKMLWKFLDLSWDTERSKTWADRAGENAPLHFHYIETVHMARVNARVQADLQKQLQLSTDSSISAAPDLGEEQPTNSTERLLRGLEAVQLIANNPEINPRCASLSITCTVVHSFQNTWTRHLAALPNIKTLEIMLEHPPEPPTFGIDHLTILLNGRIFPALESIRAMSISTDYRTLEATLTCLHLVDAPVRTRDALLVRFSALRELSIVRGVATSFDPPPTHANSSIDPLSLFQVPNLKVLYLYDPAPQLLNLLVTRKELPKLTTLVVGRLGTALGLFKIFVSLPLPHFRQCSLPSFLSLCMDIRTCLVYT